MLSVCCVSENISQTTELWWQLRLFRLVTFCAVNKRICYAIYNMSCGVTIIVRDKFAPSIYCMTSHLSIICQLRSYQSMYKHAKAKIWNYVHVRKNVITVWSMQHSASDNTDKSCENWGDMGIFCIIVST